MEKRRAERATDPVRHPEEVPFLFLLVPQVMLRQELPEGGEHLDKCRAVIDGGLIRPAKVSCHTSRDTLKREKVRA